MPGRPHNGPIGFLVLENGKMAVEIVLLSSLQAKLQVFQVSVIAIFDFTFPVKLFSIVKVPIQFGIHTFAFYPLQVHVISS